MATIILVGGSETAATQYGDRLARIVLPHFSTPPRILSCQFAKRDLAAQQDSLQEWQAFFTAYFPDSPVELAEAEQFYEQVRWADIVYLHGGHTATLLEALPDIRQFRRAVAGKMVVGSSAGANYLSAYGYSPNAETVYQGSGLVPVTTLVHYGAAEYMSMRQWRGLGERLANEYSEPVVCLPEGEFLQVNVKKIDNGNGDTIV